MKRMNLALAGLAVAAVVGFGASSAEARKSHYSFGFSTGGYGGYHAPAYYAPRPVVYPAYSYYPAPAPVYYAPPPVYPVYGGPSCGSSFSFSYRR